MIRCPNCGELDKNDINIYNENLRKQNIKISPVLPTCKRCNADVSVDEICHGGNVIVLNGTCGSGKSTVAELLADSGFLAIDGDCAIQTVRYKNNRKQYEWDELINEIACQIDILSLFGKNIVISHIILPEDMDKFIAMLESRHMRFRFFLLKPQYETAVRRCQTRTCHTSITPDEWIKHFYDRLVFDDSDVVDVIDSTDMTVEQTAQTVLERFSFCFGQTFF